MLLLLIILTELSSLIYISVTVKVSIHSVFSDTVPFLWCMSTFFTSNGMPLCPVFHTESHFCPDLGILEKEINVTHQRSSRCDAQQVVST